MKLSEVPEYHEYMFCRIKKKYTEAEQALNHCIDLARKDNDRNKINYLTQKMGDIFFLKGERDKAIECYRESVKNGDCLLFEYFFAVFLADSLHEYKDAISKCQKIIDLVSADDWVKSDDDMDAKHYLAMCYDLLGYLYAFMEDFQNALLFLGKLSTIETSYTLNYDLKLCEILKVNGYYSKVRPYLQKLLEKVKSSFDHKELAGYIGEIEQLLIPPHD